jgi:hypothetical protein
MGIFKNFNKILDSGIFIVSGGKKKSVAYLSRRLSNNDGIRTTRTKKISAGDFFSAIYTERRENNI